MSSDNAAAPALQPVTPKTRRRPAFLLGAVALLIVAALASWFVVQSLQTQNQVVVLRQPIARGEVVTDAHLAEVTVGSVQGISTVPGDRIGELVGQHALADLPAGALLPEGAIGATKVPAEGKSVVGLRLEQGRLMVGHLRPGTRVRLVVTAGANSAPQPSSPPSSGQDSGAGTYEGVLISAEPALDGAATLVNVELDAPIAPDVAKMAAENRISVIQDAD